VKKENESELKSFDTLSELIEFVENIHKKE
jgi:hypothetical protein